MLNPCLTPQEAFDWLTLPDLVNMAKNAYKTACTDAHPPAGESFIDPEYGCQWSDRASFYSHLSQIIQENLSTLYQERVIHKCTAVHAEATCAPQAQRGASGSCVPCG